MQPETPARKLAYIVSQYPKVSHSFIRREILALEKRGWQIFRLSTSGWNLELADPEDILERDKTTYILKEGPFKLAIAILLQAFRSPRRFFSAFILACRMMRKSDRPFIWHLFYFAEACWVAPRIGERGITHIHAHFAGNNAELAMLVGELANVGYSVTVHGPDEFDRTRWRTLSEKLGRATFVVAISSFTRAQILRMLNDREWDKVKVIHCGLDASSFIGLDAIAPSEAKRLVCVGRLGDQKGQLFLVKAIDALVKEGRKFELVLVGDGEHRAAIERLISEKNLAEFVQVTGWASGSRVKEEILRARALILPSFAEGLPVVIMEAMALGRPVLSTYVAGIPELVVDGQTGWLFPAGSEKDMLNAIRLCLDTPKEVLRKMGELARSRVAERHDVAKEVESLAELFEKALSQVPQSAGAQSGS